jgi:anti-sigma regulatory factor (Ser/Thr protein kinase)
VDPLTAREQAAPHRRFAIAAEEDVGVLRRYVRTLASRTPALPEGHAELAVTELGTNLLRHAVDGYILVRALDGGVELISVDRGPGLPHGVLLAGAPRPLPADRPGGGLGVGLASVRRLARTFDHYTAPDGTVLLARLGVPHPSEAGPWLWGGVTVPYGGDGPSGDAWAVAAGTSLAALVVDGLGHGPEAATAARAAVAAFDQWVAADSPDGPDQRLADLLRRAHEPMRATRGGVLAACLIDPAADRLAFTGVGNVGGRILGGAPQRLLSQPGTVGTQLAVPRAATAAHRWTPGSVLVLTSDGVDTRWDPETRPGLTRRHPAVTAAVIHRDHARGSDDAAVLVVRDARDRLPTGGDR